MRQEPHQSPLIAGLSNKTPLKSITEVAQVVSEGKRKRERKLQCRTCERDSTRCECDKVNFIATDTQGHGQRGAKQSVHGLCHLVVAAATRSCRTAALRVEVLHCCSIEWHVTQLHS